MGNDPFDCAVCGHGILRHNVKEWPYFTKRCSHCTCTGYSPRYRHESGCSDND